MQGVFIFSPCQALWRNDEIHRKTRLVLCIPDSLKVEDASD